ncbi:MAG: hypothetical protein HFJ75_07110 [Eggerthellaceae bacterium]|nr:hypothetical protein [Eggerthellaceae bacterium]
MVRVAPIQIAYNPRTLWFDPRDLEISKGDPVVVLTARGVEFGRAVGDVFEVDEKEIKALKSPLKPVKRLATEEDVARADELEARSREALPQFKAMAAEANADMHPVSVEFLFDGDKAVFYFEAEERVDFRDLVRKLAAHFHVRIDMRQIGVRDEARMVGGLGHCGQELCCKRMGGEFCPVSIRMAKEQDLSLNPQKISGLCGRLMCCLRYEYDAYKDFKSRAPKMNATVQTPEGPAKVCDLDVPREVVSLRLEGEKPVKVPIAAFEEPKDGARPTAVTDEGWEEARAATAEAARGGDAVAFLTAQFTGSDKLAEAGAVRRTGGGKKRRDDSRRGGQGQASQGGGRGRGGKGRGRGGEAQGGAVADEARKPRRRSTKVGGDAEGAKGASAADPKRKSRNRSHGADAQQGGEARAPRERTAKGGQAPRAKGGPAQQRPGQGQAPAKGGQGGSKGGPRPGQRSSGLRAERADQSGRGGQPGEGAPRRRRRRSHGSGSGEGQKGGAE